MANIGFLLPRRLEIIGSWTMPDHIRMPLAARVGPHMAGAVKAMARRYYEKKGLSYRAIAGLINAKHHINLCATTIRWWARAYTWTSPKGTPPAPLDTAAPNGERAKRRDAVSKCRRRCPMCLAMIEPGATHVCQIRAGKTLKVFGGGYL
jgi:hypothetical protein